MGFAMLLQRYKNARGAVKLDRYTMGIVKGFWAEPHQADSQAAKAIAAPRRSGTGAIA